MLVRRQIQLITSPFGPRKGILGSSYHFGVDLRSVDLDTGAPLPILAPEDLLILKISYQDKWGYTIRARGIESGYTLYFTHVAPAVEKNMSAQMGDTIAFSKRTRFMIKNGLGEHLHFKVTRAGVPINPVKYLEQRGIPYEYKEVK